MSSRKLFDEAARRASADRSPSKAYDRSTADNFDRFLFVPGTYESPDKPARLRVLYGDKSMHLTDLLDERTTSESVTAESLEGGCYARLSLTEEQLRWLHATLGDLIQRIDGGKDGLE